MYSQCHLGQQLWRKLTSAERQVLACALNHLSDRDIANRLHCSQHTVRSHIRNICGKARELHGHPLKFRRDILPLFWQTGLPESDVVVYPVK
ncbi:hypothetical protein A6A03_12575 [Chloroflexus islandicus]|uniref:HTH luxR-type domain-containing protein n=1 Tax=Chloroflexus islandicus TaxID=1707952 RepID=A0A178MDV2_9CHLR|nr:helix-turn-helix transcriptional regulator [Chloroflexus islandicus]OAN46317.1 hypothetical protein A6A03_12575 [Chloroflexus islandicus]